VALRVLRQTAGLSSSLKQPIPRAAARPMQNKVAAATSAVTWSLTVFRFAPVTLVTSLIVTRPRFATKLQNLN